MHIHARANTCTSSGEPLAVFENTERQSWPDLCCEFCSSLSAPLASEQSTQKERLRIWKKTNHTSTSYNVCTLQLRSYCLLVSLASACWRNTSSSCLPVMGQRGSKREQDCACLCFTGQHWAHDMCSPAESIWGVCDSLSRAFNWSTSLRRCSSSSRRSFELKLWKERKVAIKLLWCLFFHLSPVFC